VSDFGEPSQAVRTAVFRASSSTARCPRRLTVLLMPCRPYLVRHLREMHRMGSKVETDSVVLQGLATHETLTLASTHQVACFSGCGDHPAE